MADEESIEIRIFLIGDWGTGKTSIGQRFQKLNTTKTVEDNYFLQKESKNTKDPSGLGQKKDDKSVQQYQKMSDDDKKAALKQMARYNIMKTAKIIDIEGYSFRINFFPITEAESVDQAGQDNLAKEEDEDYEFEQLYHITLKNTKKEILNYLRKQSKDPRCTSIETIFLFCFDLQRFDTFEKIQVYFAQLDKSLEMMKRYDVALIGNKVDIKSILTKQQKDQILNFVNKNGINYYEISTFMFFNFENFFEQLFKDLLAPKYDDFSKDSFKERFHMILNDRPTFSKASRITFRFEDTPGPGNYYSNVYDYPKDPKLFRKTFTQGRFQTKIFIGKQGPIFPIMNTRDQRKTDKKKKKDQKNKTEIGFGDWDSKNKQEIKDALETNIPGYSLGTKQGNYNFKAQRKEKFNEQVEPLEDALLGDGSALHKRKPPTFKGQRMFSAYEQNRKTLLNNMTKDMKREEDERLNKRRENLKKQEEEREKKIKEVKDKEAKREAFIKEREEMNRTQKAKFRSASANKPRVNKDYSTPGPNLYDIRGKFDPKKGFSFGLKCTNERKKTRNDPEPDFPHFKSDFDLIVEGPKFAQMKRTAPRFKEPKIYEPIIPERLEPLEKRDLTKKLNERSKELFNFLDVRHQLYNKVQENKERIENEKKIEIEELINRLPSTNENGDYYINDINYKQVEDRAPVYTMKGRYEHGSIFAAKENYSLPPAEGEEVDVYGKPIQDAKYIESLPVPQFNSVKPGIPAFSFTHADRFFVKKPYQPKPGAEEVIPFADGQFAPPDQVQFSNVGYFTDHKTRSRKKSGTYKSPGFYKLKGFAEEIVEQGAKVNEIRTKIREREEQKRKIEEEKRNPPVNVEKNKEVRLNLSADDDDNNSIQGQ